MARRETEALISDDASFSSSLSTNNTSSTYRHSSLSLQATPNKLSRKLWLPAKDTECQFKCCHYCRPGLLDRSYLSLNEVASGGISPTAAAGFGFHLQKQRPVALVKHVKNLGLRQFPPKVRNYFSEEGDYKPSFPNEMPAPWIPFTPRPTTRRHP